jgi:hypothetical protein
MAMTKQEVAYMAAASITKRRVAEIATLYIAWIDAQVTSGTAIQALAAAMHSSRNPNVVKANADTWYAAFENDPPTVTSITPATGTTAGGTAVTIVGTNLTGATAVTLGGTAATSVVVVNDTHITAVTPAKTAGAKDVAVTTPAGTGTLTNGFTYA